MAVRMDSLYPCVKDKNELTAIFPLMFLTTGGKRTLQFLAGHRSDYCDILCPAKQQEALALLWQYLFSRRKEWDLIHLGYRSLKQRFSPVYQGK